MIELEVVFRTLKFIAVIAAMTVFFWMLFSGRFSFIRRKRDS